jgi:hypothetical protein
LAPSRALAAPTLKVGDVLVAEPATASIVVVDRTTGQKTVISQGGLLAPVHKSVGVALAVDGTIIVAHRVTGLIRVHPVTGAQTVLSQGGLFKDPWAVVVNQITGDIYVADSGYDFDRPEINGAGKIIRVDPVSGVQQLIASGSTCTFFPANAACQNTTTAGSYLAHPYGIAIDYTTSPATLVVADMSSFNGNGAIFRLQAVPNGAQTLLWGPATAVPAPRVSQQSPLACPMGVAVEPNGNILTSVFSYPVPNQPVIPVSSGTFYGCTPGGIHRIDLVNSVQSVVSANAPQWEATRSYVVGDVIADLSGGSVHRVVSSGVSQDTFPNWNGTVGGTTADGSVVWRNLGLAANWLIPFGLDAEPAPTPSNPLQYNIIVAEEGYGMVFRLAANGAFTPSPEPLATDIGNVTSVDVITFTPAGGFLTAPLRFNGQPTGTLPAGTTQTLLTLSTDVDATCRYSTSAGVTYGSMPNTFATTGLTGHSTPLSGLATGSYDFYVRCADAAGHANEDDFAITFVVAASSGPGTSSFTGEEFPLSEAGVWGSAGAWASLAKDNGAYALGLNGLAKLITPALGGDQFVQITYDQDPGSASWVGVTTRTQGAGNGSAYLAIAYAGEVRLYRADDSGALNFTMLASASASIGAAPRRLRLESPGNNHRVFFNGVLIINHNVSGQVYLTGQPGIAASVWGGPQVRILSFQSGQIGVGDSTPPVRTNGQPAGTLASGTTQATMSLSTNENATCRFSQQAGLSFASIPNTFSTTGGMSHSTTLLGLSPGSSYTFYVRCRDGGDNANTDDFVIAFAVAAPGTFTSSFSGVEGALSEGGAWDSPGSWADLAKNSGAFANGVNAQARMVATSLVSNQYSEITYEQDPGTASWVGVTTRTQGAGNGSGYLAIVYAGQVQLYRADDSGSLNFTMLAAVTANLGSSPRRLRLESQGNNHRVYFNGVLAIDHNAGGTIYSGGQPGIAASVWGGPQVRILSFEGGNLQ